MSSGIRALKAWPARTRARCVPSMDRYRCRQRSTSDALRQASSARVTGASAATSRREDSEPGFDRPVTRGALPSRLLLRLAARGRSLRHPCRARWGARLLSLMWVMRPVRPGARVGTCRDHVAGTCECIALRGAARGTTDTATTAREVTPLGDPVMIAKFLAPPPNGPMLRRRRLLERLSAAVAGSPVTLVCAPAGSGKTVLASAWVSSGMFPDPVVWISLDEDDERPGIFWTYVVTGLDRAGVDVEGVGASRSADSVDRSTLVRLAARLSERAHSVVLVLDNADALAGGQLAGDVDFLLRHAGERLRLVVLSRVDPALPLPLYRLERLVAEIRFRDLAFTLGEARELLRARSRNLSENEVHTVSDRTRGWAAGLRLTELPGGRSNTGGHDPVVVADDDLAAYFRSEVLGKQPPNVRDVVLATSVVDVVPAELARHLSGSKSAHVILRTLAQRAAFVGRARGTSEVSRYPPVVGELLIAQLRSDSPRRWRRLQLKAARWFESAGRSVEAVQQYAT